MSDLVGRMSRKRTFVYSALIDDHLIDAIHKLGNAKQTERKRHQLDAIIKVSHSEGETLRAGLEIGTDDAQHKTEHRHRHTFDWRAARQRRTRQQTKQHERTDFGRTELERDAHQDWRQKNHFRDAPGGTYERRHHGQPKCDAAPALLRHREAVETRHRMWRVTRQVQQDRTDGAAVLRAIHHTGEHQDRAHRFNAKCERQQN